MNKNESIKDIADRSRIRARQIDGADHDPKVGLTGRCQVCGKATRNDPRTPYAKVHR